MSQPARVKGFNQTTDYFGDYCNEAKEILGIQERSKDNVPVA